MTANIDQHRRCDGAYVSGSQWFNKRVGEAPSWDPSDTPPGDGCFTSESNCRDMQGLLNGGLDSTDGH